MSKQIIIKANVLFDGITKKENQSIVIEGNQIVEINNQNYQADYEGIVTPAFIDAHSHIGLFRQAEPQSESEGNDHIDQITPLNNPIDSIYFDDRAFEEAIDFGNLYSCIVPGSGNLFGGKAMVIKNFAQNRDECFIKNYGFKMALGYNPRSTTQWKGSRPNTRMGTYSLLEKKFDEVLKKESKARLNRDKKKRDLVKKIKENKLNNEEKDIEERHIDKEYEIELSIEDKTILELLNGKKIAKVHVHKEDDILFLIDLVNKYHIQVTAEHCCDVFHKEIFDKLAKNNIPVVYGPLGSLDYKIELKNASYKSTKLLMQSNVEFGLMTDHPVIMSYNLRDSLKYFLIQGMSDVDAINLITMKNAKILKIDQQIGSIEKGKIASLVIWNNHPLHFSSFPKIVIGEGKLLRDHSRS